jgi:histidinol-phosphate aminotransferase
MSGTDERTRLPVPVHGDPAPYGVPRPRSPVDLYLDGNEGAVPPAELLDDLRSIGPDLFRRYPDTSFLEKRLAERAGLASDRVLVTAGADDAIDRICRGYLGPGREMILPEPTFEMFPRYAKLAGAKIASIPWLEGDFPIEACLETVRPETSVVAVVTPNNPTGAIARASDLDRLAAAAPHAVLLVDLAYGEFADEDLTELALAYPNAVILRTLSKAWGLAGLRVGFALGSPEILRVMRSSGAPYAVPRPSLALAATRLENGDDAMRDFVTRIRDERVVLAARLAALGAEPLPSQANFVLARFRDARWVHEALGGLGIAVRRFEGRPGLENALRITCPGNEEDFDRLLDALETALAPEAVLFDLDGVLADVSESYREAILSTARTYDVEITREDVSVEKTKGRANNDWEVTRRLLAARGVEAPLDEVTRRFEEIYQGTEEQPGLRDRERLLPSPGFLQEIAHIVPVAVVTGRPLKDADRFLREHDLDMIPRTVVSMEDGPAKPDPAPVRTALERLGVRRAWMIGDTPDDMQAARAAGVIPIGVLAPSDRTEEMSTRLIETGGARILGSLEELKEILP